MTAAVVIPTRPCCWRSCKPILRKSGTDVSIFRHVEQAAAGFAEYRLFEKQVVVHLRQQGRVAAATRLTVHRRECFLAAFADNPLIVRTEIGG